MAEFYARLAGTGRTIDILNQPGSSFYSLAGEARNRFRQTQVFSNEIVRVLGAVSTFNLVMKFEGTIGWVPSAELVLANDVTGFEILEAERMPPMDFLNFYKGTPYLWGGF